MFKSLKQNVKVHGVETTEPALYLRHLWPKNRRNPDFHSFILNVHGPQRMNPDPLALPVAPLWAENVLHEISITYNELIPYEIHLQCS